MNRFTFAKMGRTLLLTAVLAVGAVCWVGCGGGDDDNPANNSGNNNSSNNSNSGNYSYLLSCGDRPCEAAEMPDGKTWMT